MEDKELNIEEFYNMLLTIPDNALEINLQAKNIFFLTFVFDKFPKTYRYVFNYWKYFTISEEECNNIVTYNALCSIYEIEKYYLLKKNRNL